MIPIATIAQLQKMAPVENGEPLVELDLLCDYRRNDSGINKILVRKTVAEKLIKIQQNIPFQLMVVEGYRSPIYQERYFLKQLLESYMIKEGFAPFYGEWWHFSYGDREWAAFHHSKTLYCPIYI